MGCFRSQDDARNNIGNSHHLQGNTNVRENATEKAEIVIGKKKKGSAMGDVPKIPSVDLSVFFKDGEEEGKKWGKQIIRQACGEYGFFQVVNHGVPLDLMSRAMEVSKSFFGLPHEVKLQSAPRPDSPVPAGYAKQPPHATDKNEYFMMLPPQNTLNVFPHHPSGFRGEVEEVFRNLSRTAEVIESIINDCLDLPPNFFKEYNSDRGLDIMSVKHYFPATETENVGNWRHEDPNVITLIFQDQVGGLEVLNQGHWIPVVPSSLGALVVNLGDVIQVLTNNKLKSATHRVRRQPGRSRYSFAYFRNLKGDKWVEPLPQFTTEIGEEPKYRGFVYKDYMSMRIRNKTHPPSRPQDEINISHYAK